MPSGAPYPGLVVADILEYRTLRAHALRAHALRVASASPTLDAERCHALECNLRSVDTQTGGARAARAYHRFTLRLPAGLLVAQRGQAQRFAVEIENISAGGVKLRSELSPPKGQSVSLLLEHPGGALVRLPARVAWQGDAGALGLMFAGAPVWGV